MTNTKKKTNKRKLLGAVGMLSVSAAMLVSSTFAWFTMNKTVHATNMQVKARAEGGLLISETAGHTTNDKWDDTATAANMPTGVVLLPTSSANTQAWYHANSKSANDEAGADSAKLSDNLSGSYATLSGLATKATDAVSGTNAENTIYFTDTDKDDALDEDENAYYVKYTYYLKASNEQGVSGLAFTDKAQSLSIKGVTVTGSSGSVNLDKSLRVGVAIGGKFYIFAPNYTGTDTDVPADYYVYNGSNATGANIKITPLAKNGIAYTDITSIPGVTTDTPIKADVYLWFEGEDPNCKSENITSTLDTLVVSLDFELATNSGAKSLPENNAKSTSA